MILDIPWPTSVSYGKPQQREQLLDTAQQFVPQCLVISPAGHLYKSIERINMKFQLFKQSDSAYD